MSFRFYVVRIGGRISGWGVRDRENPNYLDTHVARSAARKAALILNRTAEKVEIIRTSIKEEV